MRIVVQDIYYYHHHRKKKGKVNTKRQKDKQLDHLDYQEYLEDPASYFMRKEHWSLDG